VRKRKRLYYFRLDGEGKEMNVDKLVVFSESLTRIFELDSAPRRILVRPKTIAQPANEKAEVKKQKRIAALELKQAKSFNKDRQNAIDRLRKIKNPRAASAVRSRPDLAKYRSFYYSREWLEIRYAVLAKYGYNCMVCGIRAKPPHVDHIKPRSKYPALELTFDNLQVLCHDCNIGKSNLDETDWRPK